MLKGIRGLSGSLSGQVNYGIQGPPGPQGVDGKTAYQYALEGGYVGTEEEFAEDLLKIAQGVIGASEEWVAANYQPKGEYLTEVPEGYAKTKDIPTEAVDIGALPNTGGDLTGELRMNGQPISGLNPPTEDDQAANKDYVDTVFQAALPLAGGTMTGAINMNGQTLSGLNAPTDSADAVNKGYADEIKTTAANAATAASTAQSTANGKCAKAQKTVSLSVSGWSTSFTQKVSCSGVTTSNTVIVSPAAASHSAYAEAGVRCTAQASGTLTFTCNETPTAALTVNVVILT